MAARSETENIQRLIRFCSLFLGVPTLTIGWAFFLFPDPIREHWLHMVSFISLGSLAVAAYFAAPRLARRLAVALGDEAAA